MGCIQNYPAPVAKTGQDKCYQQNGNTWQETACQNASGQDGALQRGVAWPIPRFTDNDDGTVTDNLTGLIWLKNANAFDTKTWEDALNQANNLTSDSNDNLNDGSQAGDWRLPNVRELSSLIDYGYNDPALCNTKGTEKWIEGEPFEAIQSSFYWSSSADSNSTTNGWSVYLYDGNVGTSGLRFGNYVWPVSSGRTIG